MNALRGNMRKSFERARKYIKEAIQRNRKNAKWNWPELHLYCGMCDLKTGLYIRSVFSVFIYSTIVIFNLLILYYLVGTGNMLGSMEISDIEEYLGINISDEQIARIKVAYKVVVSYLVFWIFFKFIYIAFVFVTIYAINRNKPKMLKYVIYINFLNWIVDIFISGLGAALLEMVSKLVIILCVLFEGYNLLALNSKYKQLRGKSKLLINVENAIESTEPVTESLPASANSTEEGDNFVTNPIAFNNDKHCETCTCIQANTQVTRDANINSHEASGQSEEEQEEVDKEKNLNIKDVDTIYNQDLLIPSGSTVIDITQCVNRDLAIGQRAARPQTLHLPPYSEEKVDIVNMPVIYDENQLQMSGSPVVEEHLGPPRSSQ